MDAPGNVLIARPPPFSEIEEASVARDLRLHARASQAVPQAHLICRKDRPFQLPLERIEDGHAAKARAGDQDAVRRGGAACKDLRVQRLYLLLEAQSARIHLVSRHISPF